MQRVVSVLVSVCLAAVMAAPAYAGAPAAERATPAVAPAKSAFGWVGKAFKKKPDVAEAAANDTERLAAEIVEKYGRGTGGETPLSVRLAKIQLGQRMTLGQKIAKHVTAFSGSWGYLMGGLTLIGAWTYAGATGNHAFAPDTLNLGISIATWAVGPLLMMYQNQQGRADRQRQDALLLLLMQTEKESRHAESQLKTAHATNRELKASVADLKLNLDKVVTMLEGQNAAQNAAKSTSP